MKHFLVTLFLMALAALFAACGISTDALRPEKPAEPSVPAEPAEPSIPAEPASPVTTGNIRLLTEGVVPSEELALPDVEPSYDLAAESVRSLGLGLLARAEGENPVVSPLSAYIALGMTANGAAGSTYDEFHALLGTDNFDVNETVALLGAWLTENAGEENVFRTANSAWVDGETDIRQDYLEALVRWYGAELFAGTLSSQEALEAMNGWVSEKTEGLIPQLFEEPLDKDTALALINTLYMKAKWQSPFEAENTHKDIFHTEKGDVDADFMHKTAHLRYLTGEGYTGVQLPYRDDTLRFVALKPEGQSVRELLASLTPEDLAALAQAEETRRVRLSLPKFTTDYTMEMNDALQALGIPTAFDPNRADFSRMGTGSHGENLYIGKVLQKVKVILDEEGTEAAAATAVIMMKNTAVLEEPPVELTFDEPFLYMILDARLGTPLFLGVCDDPAA